MSAWGAGRIGVFAGTSTSGLLQSEIAYRHREPERGSLPPGFDYARTHNVYALARFVRAFLGLAGPAFAVSTACAATSKVFATAARMIAAGLCDAAIVGGADTLCATTLFGFHALGLMAEEPCRPFDAERRGISIGEAAGFVLLERADYRHDAETVHLLGVGESSDAYHMSSPHPEGIGARLAMAQALDAARLEPAAIDYINLHGTATLVGDAAEDRAVSGLFGGTRRAARPRGLPAIRSAPQAWSKPFSARWPFSMVFCRAARIRASWIPALRAAMCWRDVRRASTRVMSNSFGFGGVNCSLVLGRGA